MKPNKDDRGFAILAVVFVLIVFGTLGMAAVSLISGSAGMLVDEIKTQQAFDLATAGLAYEAEQLENDADWRDNTGYIKSFGLGSFEISYEGVPTIDTATVRSDGTVGGITRSVQQDFEAGGGGPKAFTKVAYSEGDIDVVGSASGTLTGDVSSGGDVDDDKGITFDGDIEEENSDAEVPLPDWSYWQSVADHYISSNYNFSAGTYNGIYYVEGHVTINSSVTINGTIVAEGHVLISGSGPRTIVATPPNSAIIAGDYVSFTGGSDVYVTGWVFALDDIRRTGSGGLTSVSGGLASQEDIRFTGSATTNIVYDENYAPGVGFIGGEPGEGGPAQSNWVEVY